MGDDARLTTRIPLPIVDLDERREERETAAAYEYDAPNDSLVAARLLEAHATTEPVVYDEGSHWQWEGTRWAPLPTETLAATLDEWQRESRMWLAPTERYPEGRPYVISASRQASIVDHTAITARRAGWYADAPEGIAFSDVFVRVDGRELVTEPYGPDHRQRHAYPWPYDPDADAPDTDARVREILAAEDGDDDETEARVRLWWQFVGAAVTGIAPRYLRALTLVGSKGSGKSTLARLLAGCMPPDSVESVPPHDWHDEYRRIRLRGARANIVYELEHERPIATHTRAKSIIGGEPTDGREPYGRAVTFQVRAAHLWCANRLPQVPGVDGSWWDRMMAMRVHGIFRGTREERRHLAATLIDRELPGIVARALHGAADLLAHDGYALPRSAHAVLDEWQGAADAVALFVGEACDALRGEPRRQWTRAADVHREYLRWAAVRGHERMSYHELMERLRSRGYPRERSDGTRVALRLLDRAQWREGMPS